MESNENIATPNTLGEQLQRLSLAGYSPLVLCPGLGAVDFVTRFEVPSQDPDRPFLKKTIEKSMRGQFDVLFVNSDREVGLFCLIINTPNSLFDEGKQIGMPLGVNIEKEKIDLFEKNLIGLDPNLNVKRTIVKKNKDIVFKVTSEQSSLDLALKERGNGKYFIHIKTDTLGPKDNIEKKVEILVEMATKSIQVLMAEDEFHVNPNTAKTVLELLAEKIAKIRANISKITDESEISVNADSATRIIDSLDKPYDEWIKLHELRRRELNLDRGAEPSFKGVPFPFVEVAKYDMALQPFLTKSASLQATMALQAILNQQEIELTEPVIRIHYAEIATSADGQYELLTANPVRIFGRGKFTAETSIGSTHTHISMTMDTRIKDGARYNLDNMKDFASDPRGMIFETASGNRYAIWGLDIARRLAYTAGMLDIEADNPLIDEGRLAILARNYDLTILKSRMAEGVLLQTVKDNLNTEVVRQWYLTNKKVGGHDQLRGEVALKAGLPLD